MDILVINPGGTSTKISVFRDREEIFRMDITHTQEDLGGFITVFDQFSYRRRIILDVLRQNGFTPAAFAGVVGRGGLMRPVEGGTYAVDEAMIDDLKRAVGGEHAANLGAALAASIAGEAGAPAFVVDPVSVDEFQDAARLSGLSELPRRSFLHALNQKAVCREAAAAHGGRYEALNFIVAHMGSGLSVAAHCRGRMIDGGGGRYDGPFSPERSGGLPAHPLIKLCYSGRYTEREMEDKVSRTGGMYNYLGTKDMREIEARLQNGDARAALVMAAFIYQTAREIASYGAALYGRVDHIILTGGIARSGRVAAGITERVSYLGPVTVVPGEMEMAALAAGALRVLSGEETAKIYGGGG